MTPLNVAASANIRLRSNLVLDTSGREYAKRWIPGWRAGLYGLLNNLTVAQTKQRKRFRSCAILTADGVRCDKTGYDIRILGCDDPKCGPLPPAGERPGLRDLVESLTWAADMDGSAELTTEAHPRARGDTLGDPASSTPADGHAGHATDLSDSPVSLPAPDSQTRPLPEAPANIRLRSNLVLTTSGKESAKRWIPGWRADLYGLLNNLTVAQTKQRKRFRSCAILTADGVRCDKTGYDIRILGCDDPKCGPLPPAGERPGLRDLVESLTHVAER